MQLVKFIWAFLQSDQISKKLDVHFFLGWDILEWNCLNPNVNTTQPQHCSWIGHENDCAHHPTPPPAQKLNISLSEPQMNNDNLI